jgi:YbbR domain-containing protein
MTTSFDLRRDSQRVLARIGRNLPAKLFAMVAAFTLWLFVNAGKRETQVFQFPVELRNPPERSVLVTQERVDTVAVKLNGPGALLASLDSRRQPITIDLSVVEPGREARLKIRDEMVRVPRGVRVLDIEPSRVPVRLETVRSASLPVEVARSGEPPDGYRLQSLRASPATVTVSGPAPVIDAMRAIETEPIDVSGITEPVERTVSLVRHEQLLSMTPERVAAAIAIEPVVVARDFRNVAVTVRNVERPFQLRPPRVNLSIRGPKRAVQGVGRRVPSWHWPWTPGSTSTASPTDRERTRWPPSSTSRRTWRWFVSTPRS